MSKEKRIAEEATGIIESVGGLVVKNEEGIVTWDEARKNLLESEEVAVPSAGAGSYREIFENLGFEEVEVIDWTSSAGDWCFGVKDKKGWRVAFQTNRYPYCGFKYSINPDIWGFEYFNDLEIAVREDC